MPSSARSWDDGGHHQEDAPMTDPTAPNHDEPAEGPRDDDYSAPGGAETGGDPARPTVHRLGLARRCRHQRRQRARPRSSRACATRSTTWSSAPTPTVKESRSRPRSSRRPPPTRRPPWPARPATRRPRRAASSPRSRGRGPPSVRESIGRRRRRRGRRRPPRRRRAEADATDDDRRGRAGDRRRP